jgi:hypothetical protein
MVSCCLHPPTDSCAVQVQRLAPVTNPTRETGGHRVKAPLGQAACFPANDFTVLFNFETTPDSCAVQVLRLALGLTTFMRCVLPLQRCRQMHMEPPPVRSAGARLAMGALRALAAAGYAPQVGTRASAIKPTTIQCCCVHTMVVPTYSTDSASPQNAYAESQPKHFAVCG